MSLTSSYVSTRSVKAPHSVNLSLIVGRLVSFKTLSDIVEAAHDDDLKLREQDTIPWLEKGHGTTRQLFTKEESLRKQTSIRLEEFS